MSTLDDQNLVDRLTLRARILVAAYAAAVVLLLVILIVTSMQSSQCAGGGPGAVPVEAAGASAGNPRAASGRRRRHRCLVCGRCLCGGVAAPVGLLAASVRGPEPAANRCGDLGAPTKANDSDTLLGPSALSPIRANSLKST